MLKVSISCERTLVGTVILGRRAEDVDCNLRLEEPGKEFGPFIDEKAISLDAPIVPWSVVFPRPW
jgi:hypothetical protein